MVVLDYLDFDLLIGRAGERYQAQVLKSPAGETEIDFSLPFSDQELEHFWQGIGQIRGKTSEARPLEAGDVKTFGSRLFDAVFQSELRLCLHSSLAEAGRQDKGLRILLRFTGVPELADLPWEYLYDPTRKCFLALSTETPLVRYLQIANRNQPLVVSPPLRVMVMISNPSDYPPLDTNKEWIKLTEAMKGLQQQRLVELECLDTATLLSLQQQLWDNEYHIFHFIGHGDFDKTTQDGILVFEDEEGCGQRVNSQTLGTLLHDARRLRLAVLNACEGARTSRNDPFTGIAQNLALQGVPAVIGMQFAITDRSAIMFTRQFYGAVAHGYPVDAALTEARKTILLQCNSIEWGSPVLYSRSTDGRIFSMQPTGEAITEKKPSRQVPTPVADPGTMLPTLPNTESEKSEPTPTHADQEPAAIKQEPTATREQSSEGPQIETDKPGEPLLAPSGDAAKPKHPVPNVPQSQGNVVWQVMSKLWKSLGGLGQVLGITVAIFSCAATLLTIPPVQHMIWPPTTITPPTPSQTLAFVTSVHTSTIPTAAPITLTPDGTPVHTPTPTWASTPTATQTLTPMPTFSATPVWTLSSSSTQLPTPTATPTPTKGKVVTATSTIYCIRHEGTGSLTAAWNYTGDCVTKLVTDIMGQRWVWEANFYIEVRGGNDCYTISSTACRWDSKIRKFICLWGAQEGSAVTQSVAVNCPNCAPVTVPINQLARRDNNACVLAGQ